MLSLYSFPVCSLHLAIFLREYGIFKEQPVKKGRQCALKIYYPVQGETPICVTNVFNEKNGMGIKLVPLLLLVLFVLILIFLFPLSTSKLYLFLSFQSTHPMKGDIAILYKNPQLHSYSITKKTFVFLVFASKILKFPGTNREKTYIPVRIPHTFHVSFRFAP